MEIFIEASEGIDLVEEHREIIKKSALKTLEYENIDRDLEISISVVSNDEIKELNSSYRQIDKETDCLSFPQYGKDELKDMPEGNYLMLGDVVISIEKAAAQAEEYGHEIERELSFLTAHSVLHLLGYDHEQGEEEEEKMFFKQKEILKMLGFNNT